MRGLHDTISRLKALRERTAATFEPGNDRLLPFRDFGSNPGGLKAWSHVPIGLAPGSPLVVVLHGCTQSAGGYDRGAGWSAAAERHGFAVLFPEQQRSNNPNLCFNWFNPQDARRGGGEALSIRQMVARFGARYATDPGKVFVTGLSAGGAMAAVMLATYPEAFAGGAVIAGLPFGTARSVPEAFERMGGRSDTPAAALTGLVRAASGHSGQWPTLSVWHGTADATVDSSNAAALVDQWRGLHGLPGAACSTENIDRHSRMAWCDAGGREVIEHYAIGGMGHGTPLDTSGQSEENAGPFMIDAGISSTQRLIEFWGISGGAAAAAQRRAADISRNVQLLRPLPAEPTEPLPQPVASGVQKTIEDALRSAGLMR